MTTNVKEIASRLILKHDTEEHWNQAGSIKGEKAFIPKQGEIIIYDIDDKYFYERLKIGDGISPVDTLPFYLIDEVSDQLLEMEQKLIEEEEKMFSLASESLVLNWQNNTMIFTKGIDIGEKIFSID